MNLRFLRALVALGAAAALGLGLAACGGGGGSSSTATTSTTTSSPSLPTPPSQSPIPATASNTAPITVNNGVANGINIPTVSVTVCVHGTGNCQTVNNVQVDTASFGLRIVASQLSSISASISKNPASVGGSLAECMTFADSYTWGSVRSVDVTIGSETASNIPIQMIGDLSNPAPSSCANSGVADTTSTDLGANGILGIGVAPVDCGAACALAPTTNGYVAYYSGCPASGSCSSTSAPTSQQVANPIPNFASDNNGAIVEMQPLSYNGASSATGTLVFGIGTESNNTLSASNKFQTNSWGDLSSTFNGQSLSAFLDTGSNAVFFNDSAIPTCSGSSSWYCPSAPVALSATLTGLNGASGTASFVVANASSLFSGNTNFALNDLGGKFGSASDLDLGLPFFYGRYVYVGQDQTATGGQAPYVAF